MEEDLVSPIYPLKKPPREAIELLKQSPSTLKDSTPPHLNTRSKRAKAVTVTWKAPSGGNTSPEKQQKASPTKVTQEAPTEKDANPDTPPSRRQRKQDCSGKNKIISGDADEENETPESEKETWTPQKSVPETPGLNRALIETPGVDLTPRAHRRKPYLKLAEGKEEGFEAGTELLGAYTTFEPLALESTKVTAIFAHDESSCAKPPKWSLRQLSPIRNIGNTETKSDVSSSFNEEPTYNIENVGVQVSLCEKCHTHSAWSEMKPIVMIFTFLMLSILYKGLLSVDPRLPQEFGNTLGVAVQGTFLASFHLEDYIANIFGA